MATLSNRNGNWIVQFPTPSGKRKTLALGRMSQRDAKLARGHVSQLVNCGVSRQPLPRDTAAWIGELEPALYDKLAAVGLLSPREERTVTATQMGAFLQRYIDGRTDLKPRTIANLKQSRKSLIQHFGELRDLNTITRGDMGDWHRALKAKHAPATVAMHVKKARQMFADAVDRAMIPDNPVRKLKAGSMANAERQQYVPVRDVVRVMGECPDAEWRLIFALARFAGLRVPSETHRLRWSDVKWEQGRMVVRSPKTEHHQGRATREVPIFQMLEPYLREAFELAEPGARHVIVRHRGDNLRTQAERLIERAGLSQWPRLFQNLRSSCQTDLTARHPLHVACAWVGNTEHVARRHYLQVTDADFTQASGRAANRAAEGGGKDRKKPEPPTQKPPETEGFAENGYPQGEGNNPPDSAHITQELHAALQTALHTFEKSLPELRRADIARLTEAVRSAAPAREGRRDHA